MAGKLMQASDQYFITQISFFLLLKDIHVDNMAWWLKSAGALNFEL